VSYCPGNAIEFNPEQQDIPHVSEELCFECGLCRQLHFCPTEAFVEEEEVGKFPRVLRPLFSNPNTTHRHTLVPGRGTEECKTNDVTGRTRRGEVGICIEFGRPGVGCLLGDISIMTKKLKEQGIQFEQKNPLSALIEPDTGGFSDEVQSQRILSGIIEIKVPSSDLERIMPTIMEVSREIETVFSLSVISQYDERGSVPILERLTQLGISTPVNAKINVGLGRPRAEN
jgi:hypothetical protein